MSEIPTKPGWWAWSEFAGIPKHIVRVSEMHGELGFRMVDDWRFCRITHGVWHHEVSLDKPADPDCPPVEMTDDQIEAGWEAFDFARGMQNAGLGRCIGAFRKAAGLPPASPWRPASEPPVVPEGRPTVKVFLIVPHEDGDYPSVDNYHRYLGWTKGCVAWMPIPPHGEGGAE